MNTTPPIFVFLPGAEPGPVTLNLAAVTGLQWARNDAGAWEALIMAPGFPGGVIVNTDHDLATLRQALALTGSTMTRKTPKGVGHPREEPTEAQEVERRR
jgi:hypothetical protein